MNSATQELEVRNAGTWKHEFSRHAGKKTYVTDLTDLIGIIGMRMARIAHRYHLIVGAV
jgi:hypothetical protein